MKLDPLVAAKDENKPLLSKLLAAPALRERYLGYVRQMATRELDWSNLGPVAEAFHKLIDADVKADTRKLGSYEDFEASLKAAVDSTAAVAPEPGRGPGPAISLRRFAEERRAYLLAHPDVQSGRPAR